MPIPEAFDDHAAVVRASRSALLPALQQAAISISDALESGRTCFAFGNGGSAADAQHFVAELVGHFRAPRPAFAAVALTTDPSVVTSLSNDLGFAEVFARQLSALARPGDVVVALSTSGRSPNVLGAARLASDLGCTVIGLTGGGGGELASLCHVLVDVPSSDTPRVQEIHGLCLHALVEEIEARLVGELGNGRDDAGIG